MKAAFWATVLALLSAPAYADHGAPVVACESWLVALELAPRTGVDRDTADRAAVDRGLCHPLAKVGCTYQNEVKEGLPIVRLASGQRPAAGGGRRAAGGGRRAAAGGRWARTGYMLHADLNDANNGCRRQARQRKAAPRQAVLR